MRAGRHEPAFCFVRRSRSTRRRLCRAPDCRRTRSPGRRRRAVRRRSGAGPALTGESAVPSSASRPGNAEAEGVGEASASPLSRAVQPTRTNMAVAVATAPRMDRTEPESHESGGSRAAWQSVQLLAATPGRCPSRCAPGPSVDSLHAGTGSGWPGVTTSATSMPDPRPQCRRARPCAAFGTAPAVSKGRPGPVTLGGAARPLFGVAVDGGGGGGGRRLQMRFLCRGVGCGRCLL